MRKMVEKILRGHGKSLVLCHDGKEYNIKAFWQAVTGKSEGYAKLHPGITGLQNEDRYIYIGPVQPAAATGDEIIADGRQYLIRNAQVINGAGEDVYIWGICVEKGGVPNWGMNG